MPSGSTDQRGRRGTSISRSIGSAAERTRRSPCTNGTDRAGSARRTDVECDDRVPTGTLDGGCWYLPAAGAGRDRKSTRLNSSHANISYAVFCLKKKKN